MIKKILIAVVVLIILAIGGKLTFDYYVNDSSHEPSESACINGGGERGLINGGGGSIGNMNAPRPSMGCDCGEGKHWNGKSGKRGKCVAIDW